MDAAELKDRLLFAVPKKGRLFERSASLLEAADIQFNRLHRLDIALCSNMPIALVFLPASDIAKFVAEGNVDIGITGQDVVAENNASVVQIAPLRFGKCNLCVQVPQDGEFQSIDQLIGRRIVTSFENIVSRYFAGRESGLDHNQTVELLQTTPEHPAFANKPKTSVTYIGGSVETACTLGLADAIVDLVESGDTMRAAKLKAIGTIYTSQAALFANPRKLTDRPLIEKIRRRIQGVIDADRYVLCTYNISRENLRKSIQITPGKKAPSVSPLENQDWVAVSSMVPKARVSEVMDELESVGAQDILVADIRNCRVENRESLTTF